MHIDSCGLCHKPQLSTTAACLLNNFPRMSSCHLPKHTKEITGSQTRRSSPLPAPQPLSLRRYISVTCVERCTRVGMSSQALGMGAALLLLLTLMRSTVAMHDGVQAAIMSVLNQAVKFLSKEPTNCRLACMHAEAHWTTLRRIHSSCKQIGICRGCRPRCCGPEDPAR